VFEEREFGLAYCRSFSEQRIALEDALKTPYNLGKKGRAVVFPSGMSAIYTVINYAHRKNPGFALMSNEMYGDTGKVVKHFYKNDHLAIDVACDEEYMTTVVEQHKDTLSLFVFESCSNPSGKIFPFHILSDLQKIAPKCLFVCDNTWCSVYGCNPFEVTVPGTWREKKSRKGLVVVESMTKYISGGQCIGGCAVGFAQDMGDIANLAKLQGLYVGCDHCEIFLQGCATLQERMERFSEKTERIVWWLETHTDVKHPILPGHETHHRLHFLKLAPACVWFKVNASYEVVSEKIKQSRLIRYKTSYGGDDTRFDPWPESFDDHETWVRLAIGLTDDAEGMVQALAEFLESCR